VKPNTVTFSEKALRDIDKTITYYASIREEIGEKFRLNLMAVLNSIQRNALFASVRYDDIRCARVRRFPYLVHYKILQGNNVVILAVYSTHQKPLWEK
jgi:plasmid stabilization system protein ParE